MAETAVAQAANTNGHGSTGSPSAATTEQQPANTGEQAQQQQAETPVKFEDWYGKLEDPIKDLVDDHVSGLKSALHTKSEELSRLNASFKALRKSLDNNDPEESKRQLEQIITERDDFARRAQFAEEAPTEGVANAKVAWIVAKELKLVNERTGAVDFLKLRENAPELFKAKTPTPAGNAGTGNGQAGTVKPNMSNWIRAAAGRA